MFKSHAATPHTLLLSLCMLTLASVAGAQPSHFPTGTTVYDPEQAYNGYVLFPGSDGRTHLIDMNGHEVHRWNYESFPPVALTAKQANGSKGHVLVQLARLDNPPPLANPGNGLLNASIAEVDWNGKVVRQWGSQQNPMFQHHDMRRLPNGNTLVLTAAPRKPAGFDYKIIDNDVKIITPDGNTVWQWRASDHLGQLGFSGDRLQVLKNTKNPDFLHLNTATPLGPNHWYDQGDKRFAPDNILVNSRNANVTAIIDKDSGNVVWRLGPDYPPTVINGKVPRPIDQTVGAHDPHIIPKGLPGAGNLLIFDNQGNAGIPPVKSDFFSSSRVIEVNPKTKEIVWQYNAIMSGHAPWTFYSSFISNAQRLPNGNTLIDEGQDGRIFQVTRDGKIVWEYVSPYYGKLMPDDKYTTNHVYRARLLDYDWVPKGTPRSSTLTKPDNNQP